MLVEEFLIAMVTAFFLLLFSNSLVDLNRSVEWYFLVCVHPDIPCPIADCCEQTGFMEDDYYVPCSLLCTGMS